MQKGSSSEIKGMISSVGMKSVDSSSSLLVQRGDRHTVQNAAKWNMRRLRAAAVDENSHAMQQAETVLVDNAQQSSTLYNGVVVTAGKKGSMHISGFGFEEQGPGDFMVWDFAFTIDFEAAPTFLIQTHSRSNAFRSKKWDELVEIDTGLMPTHIHSALAIAQPHLDVILARLEQMSKGATGSTALPAAATR